MAFSRFCQVLPDKEIHRIGAAALGRVVRAVVGHHKNPMEVLWIVEGAQVLAKAGDEKLFIVGGNEDGKFVGLSDDELFRFPHDPVGKGEGQKVAGAREEVRRKAGDKELKSARREGVEIHAVAAFLAADVPRRDAYSFSIRSRQPMMSQ